MISKQNNHFCVWAYQDRDGKKTKVPYNPKNGYNAKTNNINTFGTYDEARNALRAHPEKYAGIGLGIFGNLVGIDIDHCVDINGELSPLAKDIITRIDSYTEYSPSGTGIHIVCRAPGLDYDKDSYISNNRALGLEVYVAGQTPRYLTLTENVLEGCASAEYDRTEEVMEILRSYMLRDPVEMPTHEVAEGSFTGGYLDDSEVMYRMLNSRKGKKIEDLLAGNWEKYFGSQSDADASLCASLAFWTGKDAEQMERILRSYGPYREKWDKKHYADGKTYIEGTIQKAIKTGYNIYMPHSKEEIIGGIEDALNFLKENDAVHNNRYSHDDVGAGYLLADYMKPFARPIIGSNRWISYNGVIWDDKIGTATAEEAAKDMSRALEIYADELNGSERQTLSEWTQKWKTYSKRVQFLKDAASVYPVSREDFDKDVMLLNLANGTLDLATMTFRDHNPDDLITRLAPVDYIPGARCERWEQFIEQVTEPGESEIAKIKNVETVKIENNVENVETEKYVETERLKINIDKREFLQRFTGYCLTGLTKEEVFMILYGPTSRNGKSVFVNTIHNLMGSYSKIANADTIMLTAVKDGSGPSEDVARLAGARMVGVGELPQNGMLNAAKIKQMTGGDEMTARFLKENSFEFRPQFKLILHTNHLPNCNDMSVFDSGRAIVFPFSRHFEEHEQDKNLKEMFSTPDAKSGILNWILEGLHGYLKYGLAIPKSVKRASDDYRRENDVIGRFIEERLSKDPTGEIRVSEVFAAYQAWCYSDGRRADVYKAFSDSIKGAGIVIERRRPRFGPGEKTTYISGYKLSASVIAA